MKATGIIRRIDDLGRIVIPKEIRKTMHIRESDPLEIFTERDGDIILKKYSMNPHLNIFSVSCCLYLIFQYLIIHGLVARLQYFI